MSLDQTGCNWHMSGSKDGEARHSTLGQHAARTRRNASIALAKGGHTCTRWPNTRAANREREDPNSGTRPPPREDATRHDSRHSCTRLRTKDGASATEERSNRSPKPRTKSSTDDSTDRQKLTSTGYQKHGHPRSQSAQSGHQHQLAPNGLRSPGRPKEPGKGLGSVEHRG